MSRERPHKDVRAGTHAEQDAQREGNHPRRRQKNGAHSPRPDNILDIGTHRESRSPGPCTNHMAL